MRNILLLFGGGGSEHEVSRVSSRFFKDQLAEVNNQLEERLQFHTHIVEVINTSKWVLQSENDQVNSECRFLKERTLQIGQTEIEIDFCIPCFHGAPGETGEIQVLLNQYNVPFFGNGYETSLVCFNKVLTKLMAESRGVPIVPFEYVHDLNEKTIQQAKNFINKYGGVFIKSSHQGSSVGCHLVKKNEEIKSALEDALNLSPYALLEKPIKGREIEVSVYQIDEKTKVSNPGEVITHSDFYDYNEKYSESSKAEIKGQADLSETQIKEIKSYSRTLAKLFGVKDLARIDFFLEGETVYLNELNTFPGMTPISLFPRMVKNNGDEFSHILLSSMKKHLDK